MAAWSAEQMEQMRQMVAAIVQPLQGQLQEQAGRLQQAEALNNSLNTQMAQLAAQQQAVPTEFWEREFPARGGLDDRDFRSCPKFSGEVADWDNWKHSFLMCFYKVPELHAILMDVIIIK